MQCSMYLAFLTFYFCVRVLDYLFFYFSAFKKYLNEVFIKLLNWTDWPN